MLQKLADAGKVGLLMNRLLTLAPRVDLDQVQTPVFNYSVRRRGWRVENRPAGQPVLNPHATRRRIRFELSDLTRGRPRGKFDLTVCTNVLPWFGHYERNRSFGLVHQDANIRRALSNLSASLRPGGTLLLDERSEQTIHSTAPGTLASFASARKAIWVTRPSSVEPMHKPED